MKQLANTVRDIVYKQEIEAELLLHPDVRDAAVIGIPHETWGEVGVAFIVSQLQLTPEALTAYLADRLSKYKIPKHFEFVEALPRTAYGKVMKPELRERWLARTAPARP